MAQAPFLYYVFLVYQTRETRQEVKPGRCDHELQRQKEFIDGTYLANDTFIPVDPLASSA
jgi:hypothetical protein